MLNLPLVLSTFPNTCHLCSHHQCPLPVFPPCSPVPNTNPTRCHSFHLRQPPPLLTPPPPTTLQQTFTPTISLCLCLLVGPIQNQNITLEFLMFICKLTVFTFDCKLATETCRTISLFLFWSNYTSNMFCVSFMSNQMQNIPGVQGWKAKARLIVRHKVCISLGTSLSQKPVLGKV